MTKHWAKFKWTLKCERNFYELKQNLISAPLLLLFLEGICFSSINILLTNLIYTWFVTALVFTLKVCRHYLHAEQRYTCIPGPTCYNFVCEFILLFEFCKIENWIWLIFTYDKTQVGQILFIATYGCHGTSIGSGSLTNWILFCSKWLV